MTWTQKQNRQKVHSIFLLNLFTLVQDLTAFNNRLHRQLLRRWCSSGEARCQEEHKEDNRIIGQSIEKQTRYLRFTKHLTLPWKRWKLICLNSCCCDFFWQKSLRKAQMMNLWLILPRRLRQATKREQFPLLTRRVLLQERCLLQVTAFQISMNIIITPKDEYVNVEGGYL